MGLFKNRCIWGVVLLCCSALFANGQTTERRNNNYDDKYWRDMEAGFTVDINDPMPPMELITHLGDTLDSDMLRGAVVVLQFVTSWCPYSEEQIAAIDKQIYKPYGEKMPGRVEVFCVTTDEKADSALFMQLYGNVRAGMPVVFDFRERIFSMFAPRHSTLPRVVIIGSDGKIKGLFDEHSKRMMRIMKRVVRKNL